MSFAAYKAGALSCWAAFRLVLDIAVIGPVFIFAFIIALGAWPSPGAFIVTQAEALVRGAEPGKVWGCASSPDVPAMNHRAAPLLLKPVDSTYFCIPHQQSVNHYETAVNAIFFRFYVSVTMFYAVLYLAFRFALNQLNRKKHMRVTGCRQSTSGMTPNQEKQHGMH